ncbi:FeoB-associated Cys-rich membrane protein [Paenacidovorax monticola]|uniref:FeoB-associated Cys-rich membrane protein n=1 Tax=Paenacidovorax monticola TaxID=1926868 RepID=A0A7H0HFF6_9BURK|nr:FeoB-associated Cys-rich membrane protein [Paenacidovorax monticola]QNP59272.1 FeoB-associated Cys-rich membrane protein [Paenacidovorax monticola]
MVQEIVVGVIVALAAAYVVWRYLPAPWRQRLRRVHPALAEAPGCGGCSACGSESGGCGPEKEKATRTVALPVSRRDP